MTKETLKGLLGKYGRIVHDITLKGDTATMADFAAELGAIEAVLEACGEQVQREDRYLVVEMSRGQ